MTVAPVRWLLLAILVFALGGLTVALVDRHGSSSSPVEHGSGVAATQIRTVTTFDRIELAGVNNVVVRVGAKQHVVVRGDDNLLGRVTTTVRASTLVVGNTSGSFETKSPMSVEVTVPTLGALTLSGSGNILVSGLSGDRLVVRLSGSGTLSGSGSAARLDVAVPGSGSVEFIPVEARDVRASVSGSGSIFVTATRRLDASVSGSGAIVYAGNPGAVTKNVTGSGAITGG